MKGKDQFSAKAATSPKQHQAEVFQSREMRINHFDPVSTADVPERPKEAWQTKAECKERLDWGTILVGRGQRESQDWHERYGASGSAGSVPSRTTGASLPERANSFARLRTTPLTPPRLATGQPTMKAWLFRVESAERTGVFICKDAQAIGSVSGQTSTAEVVRRGGSYLIAGQGRAYLGARRGSMRNRPTN